MNRSWGVCALAIASVYCAAVPARADNEEVQRYLRSEYEGFARDYRRNPPKNLTQFFRAALAWGPYQEMPGRKYTDDSAVVFGDVTVAVDNVAINGNQAFVTVTKRMSGQYSQPRPGLYGKVTSDATSRELWKRGPTGWFLLTSRPLHADMLINGRQVNPDLTRLDPNTWMGDRRDSLGPGALRP
jgi:hypothetical protein